MKKKALSVFLSLILLAGTLTAPVSAAFADISDAGTALAAAVLESMGIATGTSAGTYSPNSGLTRAQFCTLAIRAMGLEDKAAANGYKILFSDVKPGEWYTGYVNLAYSQGVINGYGNGRFGPGDGVTYGQVATILLRLLDYTSDDVGKVWPRDYVIFAEDLGLSEGLSLSADSVVTRGQAAVLLYNMLGTEVNGGSRYYFETMAGVASTQTAVVLDTDAVSGGASGQLMACALGTTGSSIEYYSQKLRVPDGLEGYLGTLMLNSAGKVIGFVPSGNAFADVKVSAAKASGITSASGETYRIAGGAQVIYNGSLYAYGSSGYLQVNGQAGKSVRLFYGDDGAVSYVYISSGTSASGTEAVVAATKTAGSELVRRLGLSGIGVSITKNGAPAAEGDLAQYDTAYYDAAAKTLRASDYRVSGYIEAASPSVGAAETIVVAGCTLDVLECAWDSLEAYSPGSRVTLLLTDDCKVAAAYPASSPATEMTGVLSEDGGSVTLCGSGLVLTASTVSASAALQGSLVKVEAASKSALTCSAYSSANPAGKVDITAGTVGGYTLAPGCSIYEWAGSGYVYSLSGLRGVSSADLGEITWTAVLPASSVSSYRLNSAGQADILLLKDVTGNCYDYGRVQSYSGLAGINLGSETFPAYNGAISVTNSTGAGGKYLGGLTVSGLYGGVATAAYSDVYRRAVAVAALTAVSVAGPDAFFRDGGGWYVTAGQYETPVSDNVQVYLEATGSWYGGESGLLTALSSGMRLTLYYDRTLDTGGQIRVITAGN